MENTQEGVNAKDLEEPLWRVAIDPFTSMMQGGDTSLTAGSHSVYWHRWWSPYIDYPAPPDPAELAATIKARIDGDVAAFGSEQIGSQMGDLLKPPSVDDIMAKGAEKMGSLIKKPGEILDSLTQDAEDRQDGPEQANMESSIGKTMESISAGVDDVKKRVLEQRAGELTPEWTNNLFTYVTQGPQWVDKVTIQMDESARKNIKDFVGEQFNKLKKQKEATIDKLSEGAAATLATKENEKLWNETFDKLKRPVQLTAKAVNDAKAEAKKALFSVLALIGA